ncbi:NAD(P)-dependent oxidoreductase [Fibrobacter succinogenes]|uniref:precorrin-2 dehydrogenase n=1 Tax=Fibrobacter succinogenes TaxID=833 RepID=A0A380RV38_FIBSU|nr:NAD(P)-dependent oxidoreductase [Fibrobacter succinogenes]PWJ37196.1 precorrin-2 dehydrogenase/sirohydrochlorin ferrochelatase [Fibrobacter succinogenes subsp. elongatus]SUQ19443.1 precorrin-2 dehydrogenase / sirohydrochlorin ferrochelatase [Fibrobacter succinogenes]
MKAILIIAHHCILPGAYKGFEEILDRLHHDLPGTRVASTSLLDLENDLRTLLREDVESVTLLPYLLLNGQHTKNDVPRVVAKLQAEFPQIPITLLPCLGDWKEFSSMVVAGVRSAQNACTCAPSSSRSHECGNRIHSERAHSSNLFSIELNLEGRNVLVVGGGRIALRKVKTLIPTGAHITVVAPQIDPEFETLKTGDKVPELSRGAEASITLKQRPYEPLDLRCVFMVFICTDQPAVNAQVSNDARARRILVNNACDYLDGDFIVPARMDFGENIAVTVSTQGRAPSLAKKLKQKIQTEWAEDLVQIEKDFKKE